MWYKKKYILISILVLVIIWVFFTSTFLSYTKHTNRKKQYILLKTYFENYIHQYEDNIAIYIKDLSTGEEIKFNENKQFPSASLVKIPLMATVFYKVEKAELQLDEELTYFKRHRCSGSGRIKFFSPGKKFKLSQLVDLMITESDNVATNIITERIGLEEINRIIKEEFKLKHTNMDRYIMDLVSRNHGIENYTTAKEMGMLLEKIYHGKLVSKQASLSMLTLLMRQRISDRIPRYLPEEVVVAHKTGLMRDSCHDAGIVFTENGDFVIVVLTKNIKPSLAKNIIGNLAYKVWNTYL